MTGRSAWLGRLIAALAVVAALGLAIWTLYVLDRRPRTHDAHLFAYSAGMKSSVRAPSGTRNLTLRSTQPSVLLPVFGAGAPFSFFPSASLKSIMIRASNHACLPGLRSLIRCRHDNSKAFTVSGIGTGW